MDRRFPQDTRGAVHHIQERALGGEYAERGPDGGRPPWFGGKSETGVTRGPEPHRETAFSAAIERAIENNVLLHELCTRLEASLGRLSGEAFGAEAAAADAPEPPGQLGLLHRLMAQQHHQLRRLGAALERQDKLL